MDAAVSAMGFARALSESDLVKETLLRVQREMFVAGAELATAPENYAAMSQRVATVTPEMVAGVEAMLDTLDGRIELPHAFILPGTSPASGAIDLARSMLRTAERRAVGLKDRDLLPNQEVLRYLNRLADLLFMLARYEDKDRTLDLVKPIETKG
jgi:cob(I)alamin adenosyltransferase